VFGAVTHLPLQHLQLVPGALELGLHMLPGVQVQVQVEGVQEVLQVQEVQGI